MRAKKRADAKREVFRRDYAAKAALRVEEAAKEQDKRRARVPAAGAALPGEEAR